MNFQKRRTTLAEVAALAGVNKVTASVALSNAVSNTRVSPETRARILKAAQELNYRGSSVGRSLRNGQTNIIGIYCSYYLTSQTPFLSEIIGGIQEACDLNQRDVLLQRAFQGDPTEDVYRRLSDQQMDGIIIVAQPDDPVISRGLASRIPVVVIADAVDDLTSVVVDDFEGSRLIARHLANKGHKRVLYRDAPRPYVSSLRRYKSFLAEAKVLNMDVNRVVVPFAYDTGSVEEERIMKAIDRPTAIVGWEDIAAYDAIHYYATLGLTCPDDLAVVGFNGLKSAIPHPIDLTTVIAPWRQVGSTAVELILNQTNGEHNAMETVLPVEFHIGNST